MYVTAYSAKEVKPGKITYSPQHLLQMTQEMRLSHLPIFKGLEFIGNIAEEELVELTFDENNSELIFDYLERFYVTEEQTIFEAVQLMHMNHTNVLPILNQEAKYVGCITQQSILEGMANFPFIAENGVSMLVSIGTIDLSMSMISSIIESNNGKVFGILVVDEHEDRTDILVKFSSSNILAIGETFERHGYQVIQKFYNDEKQELLQSRYAQLLKYMNT